MRALTVSQPFASLIASGEKWVENRRRKIWFQGWLAIHAGSGTQYLTKRDLDGYPVGAVVAVARSIGCFELDAVRSLMRPESRLLAEDPLTVREFLEHEHTQGPFCLVLRDIVELSRPVPCRGFQGLWTLSEDVAGDVRQQLRDEFGDHPALADIAVA